MQAKGGAERKIQKSDFHTGDKSRMSEDTTLSLPLFIRKRCSVQNRFICTECYLPECFMHRRSAPSDRLRRHLWTEWFQPCRSALCTYSGNNSPIPYTFIRNFGLYCPNTFVLRTVTGIVNITHHTALNLKIRNMRKTSVISRNAYKL